MSLTLWDRFLALFGVVTTWEWCLVGCTIGRHAWMVSHEKARDGTPISAGWFLVVIKCSDEAHARALLPEYRALAAKYNLEHGYGV